MQTFIATFFSHFGAIRFNKQLKEAGIQGKLMPVPRRVSSSCGTCVFYTAEDPKESLLDADTEAIYRLDADNAIKLKEFE